MNILIAEDDARTREGLRLALVRAGHRVITAADGEAAVTFFEEEEPDIVCLDIMMPKLDGYETCKLLKADETTKHIPVILLSANTNNGNTLLTGNNVVADGAAAPTLRLIGDAAIRIDFTNKADQISGMVRLNLNFGGK